MISGVPGTAAPPPPATPAPPVATGPIDGAGRIASIDALRGVALLGIVLVNAQFFGLPLDSYLDDGSDPLPTADRITVIATTVLADRKFISIFSLLFGFGLAMQRSRQLAATGRFAGFGLRRMAGLALFGLVHALGLWYGDVLFLYALVGTALLLLLAVPSPVRFWLGVGAIGGTAVLATGLGAVGLLVPSAPVGEFDPSVRGLDAMLAGGFDPSHPAWIVGEVAAYRDGPFLDALAFRAMAWGFMLVAALLSFGWHVLGMAMLGSWMFDTGFLGPDAAARRRRWAAVCLPLGLTAAIGIGVAWTAVGRTSLPWSPILDGLHGLEAAVLSLGIVAGVAAAVDAGRMPAAGLFTAVGRMSLSAYLLESVLFTGLMKWRGLGRFGTVGRAGLAGLAVAVYAGVVVFCLAWQRRFGQGPCERLWRWLSYGRAARS